MKLNLFHNLLRAGLLGLILAPICQVKADWPRMNVQTLETWELEQAPPEIITNLPSSISAKEGAVVNMQISAEGYNLGYQWYKDGAPIASAISDSFSIPSASPSDSGTYYVKVTNVGGSVDSNGLNLGVRAKANFVQNSGYRPVSTNGVHASYSGSGSIWKPSSGTSQGDIYDDKGNVVRVYAEPNGSFDFQVRVKIGSFGTGYKAKLYIGNLFAWEKGQPYNGSGLSQGIRDGNNQFIKWVGEDQTYKVTYRSGTINYYVNGSLVRTITKSLNGWLTLRYECNNSGFTMIGMTLKEY